MIIVKVLDSLFSKFECFNRALYSSGKLVVGIMVLFLTTTIITLLSYSSYSYAESMYDESDDISLTTDSRIKTYIYSPNEVYLLVLHYGFQSHIEFAKGETIDTITLGDSFAWKLTPLGNKLFIKPMEKNIRTNMTIITNKRTYHFDIAAKELEEDEDRDLVYVIRFQYPKKAKQ